MPARARRGRRRASAGDRRRLLLALALLLCGVLAAPGTAFGYWTASGAGSGTGRTGTLLAPVAGATRDPAGNTITIAWTPSSTGAAPTGYHVQRAPSGSQGWMDVCGTDAAPVAGSSCSNTVGASGSWVYRVIAHAGSWRATSAPTAAVVTDTTAPTVTIEQAADQPDPTNVRSVRFAVEFSAAVTGFDGSDVSLTGSAVLGAPVRQVTPTGARSYLVTVTAGQFPDGTVIASIAQERVAGADFGVGNAASTSVDAQVTVDTAAPGAPALPDLMTASDTSAPALEATTGHSDDITAATTLQFKQTGAVPVDVIGGRAQLYVADSSNGASSPADGTEATGTVDGTGYRLSHSPAEGTWWYSVVYTDSAGNTSDPGPRLRVEVDRTRPATTFTGITKPIIGLSLYTQANGSRGTLANDLPVHVAYCRTADCSDVIVTEAATTPTPTTWRSERLNIIEGVLTTLWVRAIQYDRAGNMTETQIRSISLL